MAECPPAAVLFDLTGLDYAFGDAINSLALLVRDGESFGPGAVLAAGATAEAIRPLFGPNWLLGVSGMPLLEDEAAALAFLRESLSGPAG